MDILIWGTGELAKKFYNKLNRNVNVKAFVDSKPNDDYNPVISPSEIINFRYDYLIIASSAIKEIYVKINELQINLDNTIFLYNIYANEFYLNNKKKIIQNMAPHFCNEFELFIPISRMMYDFTEDTVLEFDTDLFYGSDYVRYRSLELVARNIIDNKIEGNIAEVGVFKGDFAKVLNILFEKRKLYLFDSFEGFIQNELEKEVNEKNCTSDFAEMFKNTSVDLVLTKMKYPENCIIRQGFFPKTTIGLEDEKYAFVSIDLDFEKSTYDALVYFIPRLAKGGIIFLHDYNTLGLTGIKKAVYEYEKEHGKLIKFPLCDKFGSLIIFSSEH